MNYVQDAFLFLLGGGLTAIFTIPYRVSLLKSESELSVQNVYKEIIGNLKEEITDLRKKVDDLNKQIETLSKNQKMMCYVESCNKRSMFQ